MALRKNRPHNEAFVTAQMADVSTAGSAYVAAPTSGFLMRVFSCIANAITTADCTWTVKVNGTALTGTGTITQSGSAAGDVDSVEFSTKTWVNEGDTLEAVSAGQSDTTTITNFTFVLRA